MSDDNKEIVEFKVGDEMPTLEYLKQFNGWLYVDEELEEQEC